MADKGFDQRECPLCERLAWHYNGVCCDHTPFPPVIKPQLGDAILGMGTLKPPQHPHATPRRAGGRGVSTLAGTRVQRLCGHWETVPKKGLCRPCRARAEGVLCSGCKGFKVPLLPCLGAIPCGFTYTFDASGEHVAIPCGYCATPVEIWDAHKVLVGKWIRIEKEEGHDPATGLPILKTRMIPRVKWVDGCPACGEAYEALRHLTFLAKGAKALAFLPQ